ncbi:MAG: response regulator transcription factor, partial [Actinomycetota bacterium]|nr:response regulator transcription factor [Actinomycetota bacterium]
MRAPVRVVIVDDHSLVREGTVQLLEQTDDIEVVGQAGTGEEGLRLLEELAPDVALVDINLPGMSGLELARAARAHHPEVAVLIVSAYDDYAY